MAAGILLVLTAGLSFQAVAQDNVTVSSIHQKKSCRIAKDGDVVDFTVSGRMPAHARVHATPVEREDEEGNPMLAAYDITLTDDNGEEWQPAYGQPAQVTITDPGFGNGRKLDIFHETEEGREYVTTVVSVNNTVTFPAKHFSVYVIGTPNGKNRMVVAFVKTRHNDAYPSSPDSLLYDTLCMLVKRADTIYNGKFMTRLVYPPNPGYIPKGANFFGWSKSRNYTAAPESRMTIDVVRELVYDRLKNGEEITKDLGDTMMFYSVLLKSHTINYRSLRNPNVVIGVDQVLYLLNDNPVQDYIVNESYIPTEANANFQGWLLVEGDTNIVEGTLPDDIYPNGTPIKIKGPVTFMEELAFGYWLVFNENGKGASYTAPKFLKSNDVGAAGDTLSEAQPDPPTRYGYNFGGWYADPTFDTPFVFKGYLNQDTIIHAKWVTKEQAYYTIIVWRQNVARNGYDFAESFSLEGNVGYSIASQAIVTGKEGDLDYVIVNGKKLGGIKWVLNGQESDPYTGFTISSVNPIVDQAVTTDGKAVVNIYFDRMKYKLKLYVVRTNDNGNGGYKGTKTGSSTHPEAPGLGNVPNEYLLGNWESGNIVSLSGIPQLFGSTPHLYDSWDDYRFYYYPLTAYYGENIRDRWPTHNNITVSGSSKYVSWYLMSTAKAFVGGETGTGNGTGGNTLKGEVNILDEQILGRLDDSTANLLLARYATTFCPTTFYYYFHDVNGNPPDEPSDTVITRAGENNYTYLMDKGPSFEGYTYDKNASDGLNYKYHGQNKDSAYVLNYHYLRKTYSITFRDGAYLDGNGDELQNNSSNTPLRLMTGVTHGANIENLNSYKPKLPQNEVGFVFDGWYMDEACTREYTFGTMPKGNLVVYARWRQIQYRVFLHPQAGTDPSLNWGNASQAMNFRVSYGGKVSAPTGQRDLYEFGGWYLDSTYQNRFFAEVSTLTEQNVTTPYVKNVDMTDNMDKWGVIHNPDIFPYVAYNSDTIVSNSNGDIISNKDTVNRFWITKKLDLYARWRHKLDGAEGVKVEYVCDECEPSTMPQADEHLYLDKSKMVARPAATSAVNNKIFAYWVLQNWNPASGSFVDSLDASGKPVFVYPGGPYTLHLPYAQRNQITSDSAVYLYRLRAELESFEDNHTFIVWYRNWGKPDGDTVRYDAPDTLHINMMVPIPSAEEVGTREGYIYKGWHKKGYGPEGSGQENTFEDRLLGDTATVNSIWYNPEDGEYYSKDYSTLDPDSLEFYRAYGVGADEVTPYDYFYAVWEPIKYTVRFHKNTTDPSVTGDMPDQVFKYGEEQDLSKIGYLYKCHKFLGWSLTPNGEVVFENQQAILNLTSKNDSLIHLYAQWVEESHNLVVSPDSASCLTPGSIDIRLDGVSMPNYTYRVIGLDTTVTPADYKDTVWQVTSSLTNITARHLNHRAYRVEVVTGSECVVSKDTAVFLNPVEITFDNPIETVCSGSPFVIKPSSNDDVRYLWDAPTMKSGAQVVPDTANENNPQEYLLCTITNSADSSVSYNIHAILGNCQLGDVPTQIDVSTANYPPFEITISAATDTLCGGTPLEVTATVNDNISNNNPYKLNWVFNGDTVSSTVTGHSQSVARALTMPDTCRGDFSVEVYYADVTECHVNAVKNFKVRIADWDTSAIRASDTIHCVKDTVRPHTINPSIMPVVQDGCGNTLIPTLYNTVVEPADLTCDGTVTYTYEYEDCEGKEKYWSYVYHVEKQAPEITITEVPAPTPIDFCRYQIPEIGYTLSDCDPTLVTVTQTPSATDHIRQIDKDSVVTITLTATDKCGLTATKTTTVTIPARPTVTPIATSSDFCLGGSTSVTTTATGTSSGSTITWTVEPATGLFTYADDTTFSATAHGTYTLTATVVENGCLATGETSVTVKPSAELTITNQNQTTCFGASISNVYITLLYTDNLVTSGDLPTGVTFHSENNGYVISGTPTQAGVFKYYLTASSQDPSCGVTKDSVSIEISPFTEGTVSISGDTVFCEGRSTTLRVDPNAQSNAKSYTWANSNGILPYTKSYLTVIEPGTYSVTVTSLDGCVTTGSQKVTWNPRPSVTLELPSPICPEDNVQQLQANITSIDKAPYKYFWDIDHDASFNDTWHTAEPEVTMPIRCETTTYTVTLILEDSSGCQKTVTGTILMKNEPPTISPLKESIILIPDGSCKYYIPNRQALDSLVDIISGNCTPEENLTLSIFCPSANGNGSITSTDSVTFTVTDACNQSASTKIEVRVPEDMYVRPTIDSVVLNSFEWEGATYTESTTVESSATSDVNNTCAIDRVHFTVLHTNNPDTAICAGGEANLVVKMEQPVRPAVGDVLCLKGTTAPYDTLVLRPDTFVTRANNGEALLPIGVVFYVDPNDDRKGKALALVDAYPDPCQWSDKTDGTVTDGRTDNGNNNFFVAIYDTSGLTNTRNIISSPNNNSNSAPAAYYCYHYNPLTQATDTDNHWGWYLPALGEQSMCYAQRVTINNTLRKIDTFLTNANNTTIHSNVPLDGNSNDRGYWSSTDFDNSKAWNWNQKGESRNHEKNRLPNPSKNLAGSYARAVISFTAQQNQFVNQPDALVHIGDMITFKDGSKGVVCYVNPDNPYSGWVVALQDLGNSMYKILKSTNNEDLPSITNYLTWPNNDKNDYTRYDLSTWNSLGKENTAKLFAAGSPAAKALQNGWYIPDMMQLRQWYALFPIIQSVVESNDGNLPPKGRNYWSSNCAIDNTNFTYLEDSTATNNGFFKIQVGTNSHYIRPVRDFDLRVDWVEKQVASTNPLSDTMLHVSPPATQKYYYTVDYRGWTIRDSATVIVATQPVITAKNGTNVRNLGCNPTKIPTMTVDSFTVVDNTNPNVQVKLTRDTVDNGCERALIWAASYENKCGTKADTVRVTYSWAKLTVKADTLSKIYDGSALQANLPFGYVPTDTIVKYKVKNNDGTWPEAFIDDVPSITNVGTLTYMVEATTNNCSSCAVRDTATLTITPKQVTVTAKSEEFTYDGTAHSNSGYDVVGLVGSDAITAVVTGSITFPSEIPVTNTVGDCTFTTGIADNYTVTKVNGQLTMTNAEVAITITAASDSKTYDGTALTNANVTVTSGSLFDGDELVATATGSATNVSDTQEGNNPIAEGYKIMHGEEDVTANYVITPVAGTLTITKRPVTVTAQSENKTYTGDLITINSLTVNSDENEGLVNGHTHNASFSASGTEVGEHPGTITAADDVVIMSGENNVTANYNVSVKNGILTITKTSTDFTISLGNDSYVYDAATHYNTKSATSDAATGTTTFSYSFEQNGTYVSDLSSLTKTEAGEYTIYVKGTNPNYLTEATTTAKLIITKRPVTFTATSDTIEYTGSTITINSLTVSSGVNEGLVTGHTHNVTFSASGTEVGEHTGTITTVNNAVITNGSTDVTANYNIAVVTGKLTITKSSANFTINLADDEYVYNEQPHANTKTASSSAATGTTTYSYSFEQNGTYVSDLSSLTKTEAGEYMIYVKGVNPNYENEAVTTAKLKINARPITLKPDNASSEYTGSEITYATANGAVSPYYIITSGSLVSGHTITAVTLMGAGTAVGTYDIAIADNSVTIKDAADNDVTANYAVTRISGTLTIGKSTKAIAITSGSYTGVYDGQPHTAEGYTVTYGGQPVTADANGGGKVFTLPTGDRVTISAPASIQNVGGLSNGYSYVVENATRYTTIDTTHGWLSVTARPITLKANDAINEYTGSVISYATASGAQSPYYTISNGSLASGHNITAVTLTGTGTTVGEYPIAITEGGVTITDGSSNNVTANYAVTRQSGTLTISENSSAIVVTPGSGSKTYDGTPLTKTAHDDFTVTGVPSGFTWTAAADGTVTNVTPGQGEKAVNAVTEFKIYKGNTDVTNQFSNINTTATGTLTINARPITLKANDAGNEYTGSAITYATANGATSPYYTISSGSLANGHNITAATLTGAGTTVGTYNITITEGSVVIKDANTTVVTANYAVTRQPGTLTISKNSSAIVVTPGSGSKTYDGTPLTKTAHGDFTVSGLPAGFTWTATADGTVTNVTPGTSEKATNAVTSFKIYKDGTDVTAQFGNITTSATGTLTITKRAVTVTAQNKAFVYTGAAQSWPEYDVSGLVGNDAISAVVTGSITFPSESPVTNELASYEFTTGAAGNYTVETADGKLTMTKASVAITITAASDSKTYDGTALTNTNVTVTSGSLFAGDELVATATGSVTNVAQTATGNNSIATGYKVMHGMQDVTENYSITPVAGKLTITKRPVTFTATSETKEYTGSTITINSLTVSSGENAGLVSGHTHNVTFSASGTEVGEYTGTITATIDAVIKSGETDVTANYNVSVQNGKLTISKTNEIFTIELADDEHVYDAQSHVNTHTPSSTAATGTTTYSYSFEQNGTYVSDLSSLTKTDAGEYTIYVKGTNPNYQNEAVTTAKLKIKARPITLKANDAGNEYTGGEITYATANGAVSPYYTIASGSLASGQSITDITLSGAGTTAGTYPITITESSVTIKDAVDNDVTANYAITRQPGTLTIGQNSAAIVVVPGSGSKAYDGTPLTKTEPGDFTVTGVPSGFTWTASADGTVTNVTPGTGEKATNAVTEFKIFNTNNEDVTGQFSNINTTATGTLTITARPVTLKANNVMSTYTGSEITYATATNAVDPYYAITNTVAGEGLVSGQSITSITLTGAGTAVGNYDITITQGSVAIGDNTANYAITLQKGILTISQYSSEIVVIPGSGSKTYDGTPLTKTAHDDFTVIGLPEGFTWTATANGTVTNVTPGAGEIATNAVTEFKIFNANNEDVTGQFSYINTTATGTLTITARPITLKAKNAGNEYTGSVISYATAGDAVSPYYTISSGSLADGHNITAIALTGAGTTVGTYPITISEGSVTIKGTSDNNVTTNYAITRQPGTLTIGQNSAAIVVVPGSGSKAYDGTPLTKTEPGDFTVTGVPSGFTWTAAADGTVTNVTPGQGEKAVNAVTEFKIYKGNTDVTDQFSNISTTATGTLTINARPITLKANNAGNEYTGGAITYATAGNAQSPYYSIMNTADGEGLVSGQSITAITLSGFGTTVGSYDITITEGSVAIGDNTANYAITLQKGTLTISQNSAAIVVTPGSGSKTYDGTPLTKTAHGDFTVSGVPAGFTWTATADGTVTNVTPGTSEKATNAVTSFKIYKDGTDVTAQFGNITTSAPGTLTITKKAVTVTAQNKAFVYTGEAQSWAEYDVVGLVGSDAISAVVTGSITFPSEIPVTNVLTSYQFTTGTAGNYTVTPVNGQLTMTSASVPITITAASQAWTYDGGAHSNSAVAVTGGDLLTGDALVATATGSVTNVSETAAGNNPIATDYKIVHNDQEHVNVDVTANYVITPVAGKLTINPKAVTVTAQNKAFVYTGEAQSWPEYDVDGLVGNDAISAVVTGSITFPSESPVTNELESYEFTTGAAGNYTVETADGELTMTNASVAITITAASEEWTYDGSAHQNTTVTVTGGSLLTGDALVATATGSVTNVSDTHEGNNPIATGYKIMHGNEDVTANYVIATQTGTLTIKAKSVTVTAKSEAFTYDGTVHSNSGYNVVGLVGSDAISATVTGSITFPSESPVTNELTNYEFTAGTAGNYTVAMADGQLTMTTAEVAITITAASQEWTYDGSAHSNNAVTLTSGSLLAGDVLVATATGSVKNVSETATGNNPIASDYKIMHGTEDVTANYSILAQAGTLTIKAKPVTVTAKSEAFTYNGTAHSNNGYNVVGLVGNDAISAVVTGSITFPSESPVTNTLTSYEFTTGTAGNYSVTTTNGQLTMTNATVAITITAASDSKTYDGSALTNTNVTVTSGSLLTGDVLVATATGSVTNVEQTVLGNNPIAAGYKVMHGDEDVTANYVITSVAGTLTINPKVVTVTAKSEEFTYDGAAHSNSGYDVVGLVGSDAISAVVTGSITFPSEIPVTNVLTSYQFTTGTAGNYTVTPVNGQLTMTTASVAITITAASQAWTFDGGTHQNTTVTVTSGSLMTGDALVATATGSVTNVSDTQEGNNPIATGYKIMHGDEDVTANYVITPVAGKLTINAKAVTVMAKNKTFVYTGTAQSWPQYEVFGLVGNDAINAVITSSITFPSESPVTNVVDSYTFTAGSASNYTVSLVNGQLTMVNDAVPITITAASQTWTYDGSAHSNTAVTVTSGSLLTGDELVAEATGSVTNVAQTATGNNLIAAGYKVMHGDEDVTANYVITPVAGKLTINPKAVTVTAKSDAFTYDGSTHSNSGYDVVGLVGSDAISAVVTGSITFPSQSPAANVLSSYAFTTGTPGNYSVTTANGSLTMTNAAVAITITAASEEWTYDGNAHSNAAVTVTSGSLLTGDALVATAAGSVTNVAQTSTDNNPIAEGYKVMHGTQDVTANYVITPEAGTLTITPRTVTVSVADKIVEYNGSVQSGNTVCTFSNLVSGQMATIGYTAASGKLVSEIPYDNGSYANDFMVKAGQTDVTSNYILAQQTRGKLTIKDRTKKFTITVVANSNTGNVYDGTVKSVSGIQTLVFSYNNNLFTVSGLTTSNPSSANVCELTNAISGTPAVTDADGNDVTEQFDVITFDGVLEILKRPVTVSVADKTVEYNGSEQYGSTAYTFTNVVAGQTATIDYTAASGTMESATPYNNGSYGSNFKVMLGETNVTSNYTLTLMAKGKLIINPPPLTVTAMDSTKVYDGEPLSPLYTYEPADITPTFQFSVMNGDDWGDWMDAVSIREAGTLTYKVKATINDLSVESNEGTLTIMRRPITLALDSSKVYDGTPFMVTYDQLHVTGLVNGDHLASGEMWTESTDQLPGQEGGYQVGVYESHEGSFEADETVGHVVKAGFSVVSTSDNVTSSYAPKFNVKLTIKPRAVTITAASDSKVYDGIPLTNDGHSVTVGSLAPGDSYTATVTGSQLTLGSSDNVPSDAVITRNGADDVTSCYAITYVNGTLTVTETSDFVCPAAETFFMDDCETTMNVTLAGTPVVSGVAANTYTVTNNLSDLNPLGIGTHVITWKLLDLDDNLLATCDQTVTVDYKPCVGVTWQGYNYNAVRVGSQCWLAENLRWPTGNYSAYKEQTANSDKFGYLYSWYTAVGVGEDDDDAVPDTALDYCGNPYVQGICPEGWGIPSLSDVAELNLAASTSQLKDPSTDYWLPGYEGLPDGTGFDARGGGRYNASLDRYEDLLTGFHFWASDAVPGATSILSACIAYHCDSVLVAEPNQKNDKKSVRCVRKKHL